jgi:hypothetical protein
MMKNYSFGRFKDINLTKHYEKTLPPFGKQATF